MFYPFPHAFVYFCTSFWPFWGSSNNFRLFAFILRPNSVIFANFGPFLWAEVAPKRSKMAPANWVTWTCLNVVRSGKIAFSFHTFFCIFGTYLGGFGANPSSPEMSVFKPAAEKIQNWNIGGGVRRPHHSRRRTAQIQLRWNFSAKVLRGKGWKSSQPTLPRQ